MPLKNSEVWFGFLDKEIGKGPTAVSVRTESLPENSFLLRIEQIEEGSHQTKPGLAFAAALIDEGPVSRGIRSGDPSLPLAELEAAFRALRNQFPALPLLALLKPDPYRPRSHAWMLGEFLAERDILLWADLRHLHPARMADWARNLSECGLASPRAVIQVTGRLCAADLPALAGTGVWLVRPESGEYSDRLTMEQV